MPSISPPHSLVSAIRNVIAAVAELAARAAARIGEALWVVPPDTSAGEYAPTELCTGAATGTTRQEPWMRAFAARQLARVATVSLKQLAEPCAAGSGHRNRARKSVDFCRGILRRLDAGAWRACSRYRWRVSNRLAIRRPPPFGDDRCSGSANLAVRSKCDLRDRFLRRAPEKDN